jgi:hypothetical protein
LARVRGRNLDGVVIERISLFPVRGLGSAAIGIRLVQRVGRKHVYSTYVDFQLDRLLCESVIRRADDTRVDAQAVAIARVLASRIVSYARGKLRAKPVTLPRPLGLSRPGPKAPNLESMALTARDVGRKARVFDQTYLPDDNAIASYVRRFQFGRGSGLLSLRNQVSLERSRREAAGRMLLLRAVFTGPEGAATLAGLVAESPRAVRLEAVRRLGVGDDSFAIEVSLTNQGRRVHVVLAYVQHDRVIATLVGAGGAKGATIDGVAPHARTLDKRIRRGLKSLAA